LRNSYVAPRRPSELLSVLPRDRSCGFEPEPTPLLSSDISALNGKCVPGKWHPLHARAVNIAPILATLTRGFTGHAIMGVKRLSAASLQCSRVIPEIDIWRAATLMFKRYGDKALEQSRTRIDELASDGDHDVAVTWPGSQLPLSSLPARHHPDRCTNRNDPDTVA
jgi:hypothetical protein